MAACASAAVDLAEKHHAGRLPPRSSQIPAIRALIDFLVEALQRLGRDRPGLHRRARGEPRRSADPKQRARRTGARRQVVEPERLVQQDDAPEHQLERELAGLVAEYLLRDQRARPTAEQLEQVQADRVRQRPRAALRLSCQ